MIIPSPPQVCLRRVLLAQLSNQPQTKTLTYPSVEICRWSFCQSFSSLRKSSPNPALKGFRDASSRQTRVQEWQPSCSSQTALAHQVGPVQQQHCRGSCCTLSRQVSGTGLCRKTNALLQCQLLFGCLTTFCSTDTSSPGARASFLQDQKPRAPGPKRRHTCSIEFYQIQKTESEGEDFNSTKKQLPNR